jgi:RimJ/RimL family protein N-acetyltransferase
VVSLDVPPEWLEEQGVQLGYRLTPSMWGQGLGSEAAELAIEATHEIPNVRRVIATVDPANTASVRVLQKIGMALEREVTGPAYDHPDHLYAIALHPHASEHLP